MEQGYSSLYSHVPWFNQTIKRRDLALAASSSTSALCNRRARPSGEVHSFSFLTPTPGKTTVPSSKDDSTDWLGVYEKLENISGAVIIKVVEFFIFLGFLWLFPKYPHFLPPKSYKSLINKEYNRPLGLVSTNSESKAKEPET